MSGGGGVRYVKRGLPHTVYHMIHVILPGLGLVPPPHLPCEQTDRQTPVRTLPSHSYLCDRQKRNPDLNVL